MSRVLPLALSIALLVATPALAAAPMTAGDLDKLQAIAAQEGLPVKTIRMAGPQRLAVRTEEKLAKDAFIKRASLIAYFVFHRMPGSVEAIAFENAQGGLTQACTIKAVDHASYLADQITKPEYERRLAYRQAEPVVPVPALPAVPASPVAAPQAPVVPVVAPVLPDFKPAPAPAPAAAARVLVGAPTLTPLVAAAYGLGFGAGRFDSYMVEYGHPLLPTLDVRPSMQIISPFSPVNFLGGGAPLQGLSLACDLLGTTRQAPGASGISFEGGLGARVGTWQTTGLDGIWPAMHLRVGMRWKALAVGMRYPLMNRAGDPTAGWEASVGVGVPLGAIWKP